ncbi:MAG: Holliday junction branch migration protein RuvA [Rhodovibrionaceae bacterium]
MIGKLTGLLDSTGDGWALVDVGGVGYVVFCSARTLSQLPVGGGKVSLLIDTHVREDHIHLYGFAELAERDWFRLLSSVQGVGARMALAILSALPPQELVMAVASQDKVLLTRANGVGPKLAQRIVTELKDKAGGMSLGSATAGNGEAAPVAGGVADDAVSALVSLGYRRSEAFGAVSQALRSLGGDAPLDKLIKEGLRELAT